MLLLPVNVCSIKVKVTASDVIESRSRDTRVDAKTMVPASATAVAAAAAAVEADTAEPAAAVDETIKPQQWQPREYYVESTQ